MHRGLLYALIGLVIFAALITVVQIWAMVLSWDIYIKLMITFGVLVLLIGFLLVIKIDFAEHKKLKDDNYLD